jgi:hypothetical protein
MAPARPLIQVNPRFFTLEEANRTLPLVKMIVGDIVRQSRLVSTLQQRVERVVRERRQTSDDPYSEELAQTQSELETEVEKLHTYFEELRSLGVELKDDKTGLCDFLSLMNGREVYLCWRLGEPEVQFWHDLDAGFAGRQKIHGQLSPAATDERH